MRRLLLVLATLLMLAPLQPGLARDAAYDDVFTIGVVESSVPAFVEESRKILASSNYHVVMLPREDAPAATLLARHRLDAVWSLRVTAREMVQREGMFGVRRSWKLGLEGLLSTGGAPWVERVALEEPLQGDDPAALERQASEITRRSVVRMLDALMQRIGFKPIDNTPPDIVLDYPKEAQSLRTSTVLVLGHVSDGSKVAAVRVNGVALPFVPQRSAALYYPVRFGPGPLRERLPVTVEAADPYGNTATRTVVLYRGHALTAKVLSASGRDVLLDRGKAAGVVAGMAFIAYNVNGVRDPLSGRKRFEWVEVGPLVITRVYEEKAAATLLVGGWLRKGDVVK